MAKNVIPRVRLDRCEELYTQGVLEREIAVQIAREFHVSTRAGRRTLQRVRERMAKRPGSNPAAVRARSEAMMLETYAMAKAKDDCKTMATIAYRLAELHGAAGPLRVEHTARVDGLEPKALYERLSAVVFKATDSAAHCADELGRESDSERVDRSLPERE